MVSSGQIEVEKSFKKFIIMCNFIPNYFNLYTSFYLMTLIRGGICFNENN